MLRALCCMLSSSPQLKKQVAWNPIPQSPLKVLERGLAPEAVGHSKGTPISTPEICTLPFASQKPAACKHPQHAGERNLSPVDLSTKQAPIWMAILRSSFPGLRRVLKSHREEEGKTSQELGSVRLSIPENGEKPMQLKSLRHSTDSKHKSHLTLIGPPGQGLR